MSNNKFTWGETVKVKDSAPLNFRPGAIVSVCGMTKIDSHLLVDKYNSQVGEWIYTIEYLGGSSVEVPERYLEEHRDV